ncbi:MAG: hypothetical protein GXO97_06245 [Nitrospirae bacterium]|nr:hypothetical protein [Nitrospirota bacterium]
MQRRRWYCIYTKPAHEDIVSYKLSLHGQIEIFNPKLKTTRYIRGRYTKNIEPLFPCYIFARFCHEEYGHMITYTRGVRYIVGSNLNTPCEVEPEIIEYLRSMADENHIIQPPPPDLRPGDEVIIKEGPLKGIVGIFQYRLKASERVLILLKTISYQARMQIDPALLVRR